MKLEFTERFGNSVQSAMEATAEVRFIGTQTVRAEMLDYRKMSSVAKNTPGWTRPSSCSVRSSWRFAAAFISLARLIPRQDAKESNRFQVPPKRVLKLPNSEGVFSCLIAKSAA